MSGRLIRRVRDAFSTEDDEGTDHADDVWDLIPSWQYEGRHVESGGLSRDEQERSLADVQRQAEQVEREDRTR